MASVGERSLSGGGGSPTAADAAAARPVLRVLGVQLRNVDATTPAERDANLAAAAEELLRHPGHDVYVLPELSAVGYGGREWLDRVASLAEDADDGPSRRVFSQVAKELGAFVVYGFPRRRPSDADSGDRPTIAQAVVGPDGALVGVYDKLHLCGFGDCNEGWVFRRGGELFAFEAQHGYKLGVLVCYDLRHPTVWEALAERCGVDAILHPSCFPNDGSFATWHPFVKTRAVENQVYVLSLSRAHPHFGRSIAVGPRPPNADAAPVLGAEPGVLPMAVDRAELDAVRAEYPFLQDRRRDYDELVNGCVGAGTL